DSFLLATVIAQPKAFIHTNTCYCDFGNCLEVIGRLGVGVNSIENGKPRWKQSFKEFDHKKGLGRGLLRIHSPVIPPSSRFKTSSKMIIRLIPSSFSAIQTDSGLQTCTWPQGYYQYPYFL
ncbi:unnamed protein product, partial [Hapterophycus canaliculatus]